MYGATATATGPPPGPSSLTTRRHAPNVWASTDSTASATKCGGPCAGMPTSTTGAGSTGTGAQMLGGGGGQDNRRRSSLASPLERWYVQHRPAAECGVAPVEPERLGDPQAGRGEQLEQQPPLGRDHGQDPRQRAGVTGRPGRCD